MNIWRQLLGLHAHHGRVRLGREFSDREFAVLRRYEPRVGLFSHYITNLGMIAHALERGFVPVVDMRYPRTMYHQGRFRRENIWELFFEQPCGFSLPDIRHARHVRICEWCGGIAYPSQGREFFEGRERGVAFWRDFASRFARVRQSPSLAAHENPKFEAALVRGKVLGVLARGTDYAAVRPSGHPILPSAELLIEKSAETMKARGYANLFLATEDAGIAMKFQAAFGDELILADPSFVDYSGSGYLYANSSIVGDLERGWRYFRAIYDLSRCTALVAGRSCGTIGALLMSKGFEYEDIPDLGVYGQTNRAVPCH